jgi:hypothetical protein
MASPVVSQGQSRMTGQPSQLTWRWLTSDTSRDITKRYKQEKAAIDHAGWAMQSSKCRGINKGRLLVFSSRAAGWGPRASLIRPIKCRKCRASRGSGSATGPRQRQYMEKVHQGYENNETTWHNGRIPTASRNCCSLLQFHHVNFYLTGDECAACVAVECTEILRHSNDTEKVRS